MTQNLCNSECFIYPRVCLSKQYQLPTVCDTGSKIMIVKAFSSFLGISDSIFASRTELSLLAHALSSSTRSVGVDQSKFSADKHNLFKKSSCLIPKKRFFLLSHSFNVSAYKKPVPASRSFILGHENKTFPALVAFH